MQKEFNIPVELLAKRMETVDFPHKIIEHTFWTLKVSKLPIQNAEQASFQVAGLIPPNILLTSEIAENVAVNKNNVFDAITNSQSLNNIKKRITVIKDLINLGGKIGGMSKLGFHKASESPLLWLNYEAVLPAEMKNVLHTHITKGKNQNAIAPSPTDIKNIGASLKLNEETLLFVFPQDEMDLTIIEANEGQAKTEDEILNKAVEIALRKRFEKDIPFFVVKIRKTKNQLELHIPSKIILDMGD